MNVEILEFVMNRVATVFKVEVDTLNESTDFELNLKAKSADIVQVTTALEDEYDIEIPYMEFKRKKTIGEAVEFIEELIEG